MRKTATQQIQHHQVTKFAPTPLSLSISPNVEIVSRKRQSNLRAQGFTWADKMKGSKESIEERRENEREKGGRQKLEHKKLQP